MFGIRATLHRIRRAVRRLIALSLLTAGIAAVLAEELGVSVTAATEVTSAVVVSLLGLIWVVRRVR